MPQTVKASLLESNLKSVSYVYTGVGRFGQFEGILYNNEPLKNDSNPVNLPIDVDEFLSEVAEEYIAEMVHDYADGDGGEVQFVYSVDAQGEVTANINNYKYERHPDSAEIKNNDALVTEGFNDILKNMGLFNDPFTGRMHVSWDSKDGQVDMELFQLDNYKGVDYSVTEDDWKAVNDFAQKIAPKFESIKGVSGRVTLSISNSELSLIEGERHIRSMILRENESGPIPGELIDKAMSIDLNILNSERRSTAENIVHEYLSASGPR